MSDDLWTWKQTSKPVVKMEHLAGRCPKCDCIDVTLEYEARDPTDWLKVTCYRCGYQWKVDPQDKKKLKKNS